ncbi:MAG: hypothetical protein ABIJ25_15035 [Pseudomonadota bacterium]
MEIKEMLKHVPKLIDIQNKVKDFLKGGQVGLVNIQNITINVPPDSTFWKDFTASKITPEIEKQAMLISEEKLECIAPELNLLSSEIVLNIATATMATAALKISASGHVVTSDNIDLKINKIIDK